MTWRSLVLVLAVAGGWVLACASEVPPAFERAGVEIHVCEDPRPVGCPMIGEPVCGRYKDGGIKVFANSCRACFNPAVVEWHDETCFPGEAAPGF